MLHIDIEKLKITFKNEGGVWRVIAAVVFAILVWLGYSDYQAQADGAPRNLLFQKGTYLGKPDSPVSKQARRALLARIQRQSGSSGPQGGGGSGSGTPPDTRPPASTPLDALRERARRQSGN